MRSIEDLSTDEQKQLLAAMTRFDAITDPLLDRMDHASRARETLHGAGDEAGALRYHAIVRGCLDQCDGALTELKATFERLNVDAGLSAALGGRA